MSKPSARLHQLDGLRALAVTVVVLHHAGAASVATTLTGKGYPIAGRLLSTGTASGVELFFVLSGIVLLRPYVRRGRPLALVEYLKRRAQRLWPPFIAAWLVSGLVIHLTTSYPSWWTRDEGNPLPIFSVSTWLAQLGIAYLGTDRFNWAWWSLTVEMIFYVAVPPIVLAFARVRPTRTHLVACWIVAVLVALAAQQVPEQLLPPQAWPIPSFAVYGSCFAAGVLLAAYDFPPTWGPVMMLVGGVYAILACAWPALNVHVGWGLLYFGLVTVALDSSSRVARLFSQWPFVWLGERSYSLFLVHFAVFTSVCLAVSHVTTGKGPVYFALTRLIELPLALLASMVIFDRIERRFAHGLVSGEAFWPTLKQPASAEPSAAVAPPLAS